MKLTTYRRPLLAIPAFDELFDGFFDQQASNAWEVRFHEDKDAYHLQVDLPGVKKEEVKLDVENESVSIKATRKMGWGENISESRYERTLTIPRNVDTANIKAQLQDGVLELTLPKREDAKPRSLQIDVK